MPTLLNPLITDAGLAAAIAATGAGLQLAITHVALGTGQYTPTVGQTNMTGRKEKATIAGGTVAGTGAFRINVMFPAWAGTPNPYSASEIGFWAGDPDAGGILFAVYSHTSAVIVTRNALDYVASFGLQLARVPTGSVTVEVDPEGAIALALVSAHEADANPHPQYVLVTDIADLAPDYGLVRKPTVINPVSLSTLTGLAPLLQGDNYYSLYGVAHGAAQFQLSIASTFASTIFDSGTIAGPETSSQVPAGLLAASTAYFARCRYRDVENVWSSWSAVTSFTTGAQTVSQPSITAPANGATGVGDGVTLTASVFSMVSGSDTHGHSDWEIWTGANGTGTQVFSLYESATNKTSIDIPAGTFGNGITYYPRVRYAGVSTGYSAWSAGVSFTTAASFSAGTPGSEFGGGFFAGYIMVGAQKYALVVAPKSGGELGDGARISTLSTNLATARSVNDGKANTDAMYAAGPDKYPAAKWVKGLTLGGFNDWHLPARDELEIVNRYFNPDEDNTNNGVGARYDGGQMGQNANSVPVGVAYTIGSPAQTTVVDFKDTGPEALGTREQRYLTSTYATSGAQVVSQKIDGGSNGEQVLVSSTLSSFAARAVRRIPVAS